MSGTVYALLVGIDSYPNPAHRLSGCRNDVGEIEQLLNTRVPEGRAQITTLVDEQATRAAVIAGFRSHLSRARAGDTALFYYAGHGSRERAPEAFWPIEPDHLDETLVLWDSRNADGWDLADKELGALIQLVGKGGPHVVVILDCCHSGSGTRAIADTAMTTRRMPLDARDRPVATFLPEVQALVAARTSESGWNFGDDARHILLAACRDDEEAVEFAAEGRRRGAFTYFLMQTVRDAPGAITYRTLADGARVRLTSRVTRQAPQLEATVDADLDRLFLEGTLEPRPASFLVTQHANQWWMDGGRMHGVPAAAGTERTHIAIFAEDATASMMATAAPALAHADLDNVDVARSRVNVTSGTLTAGRPYRAVITGVPLPARHARLTGDAAAADQLRRALATSTFVAVSDSATADFVVQCATTRFTITRAADDARLATAATADEATSALEQIVRWMFYAGLENPVTAIRDTEFEVTLLGGPNADTALPGSNVRLTATRKDDKITPPEFRLRFSNRGNRDLYFGILALDETFALSTDLIRSGVMKLSPGDGPGFALDGDALAGAIPDALRGEGRTESVDILKVIVSTVPFQIRNAAMNPLGQQRRALADLTISNTLERLLARTQTRTITAASAHDEIRDFRTHTIFVTTVEPREGVEVTGPAPVDVGAAVRIEPHRALRARARLAALEETRSDLGSSIVPPILRGSEASEMLQFTSSRGTAPALSVLELADVANHDAVSPEAPLVVHLPLQIEPGATVLALAYDGDDHLVLGRATAQGPETTVQIARLPHPLTAQTRSLTGSIKILFYKFTASLTGSTFAYPLLAGAVWNDGGKVQYDHDATSIAASVAAASRVVVFVHGIIGDTLAMGAQLAPRPGDVYLAYDYENLHTSIERNAEALQERLAAVGLTDGHGKELVLVAHSMGGLVSRWFIEKLGGRRMVSRLILVGTPNAGSNWSTVEDWVTGMSSLVVNSLTTVAWPVAALGALLQGVERIDNSLDQMKPGSALLQALGQSEDPGIPYTVIAGNTSLASDADEGRVRRLLKKVLHTTTSVAFLFQPNDIAVTVVSIGSLGKGWATPPVVQEVACDHISYFAHTAGLTALRRLL